MVGSAMWLFSTWNGGRAISWPRRLEVDEVLGDEEVGHAGRGLERGGQPDRGAVVVVRRDRDVVRLGHGGDLAQLEDAAAVADVGVEDVGGAPLDHLAELGLGVDLLAGDDRQA